MLVLCWLLCLVSVLNELLSNVLNLLGSTDALRIENLLGNLHHSLVCVGKYLLLGLVLRLLTIFSILGLHVVQ